MSRCPDCSFNPTSQNDYCAKHRPLFAEVVAKLISVQIGIGHPFYIRETDVPKVQALLEELEEKTQGCDCGSSCPKCAEADDVAHTYTEADEALHEEADEVALRVQAPEDK